ncbi:MAG: GNAT family N-acetyltransferase [Lewinellaceae bacterium]|nr:GNAT family N-acetyltransferase [Lewinellaceae bacterium]
MSLNIRAFTGESANQYKSSLAALRIQVFREFPYLYDGSVEYEEKYLETFIQSEESVIVVAFDGEEVIGVSTGIPLKNEPTEIQQDWINGGYNIDEIFYFSESVLNKDYRGHGIGVRFMEEREKWARQLGYKKAIFCGVIRDETHPRRPKNFVPLDRFWEKRGFSKKVGFTCKISWKEMDETEESEKELQFWEKDLV